MYCVCVCLCVRRRRAACPRALSPQWLANGAHSDPHPCPDRCGERMCTCTNVCVSLAGSRGESWDPCIPCPGTRSGPSTWPVHTQTCRCRLQTNQHLSASLPLILSVCHSHLCFVADSNLHWPCIQISGPSGGAICAKIKHCNTLLCWKCKEVVRSK